jgi:hypothetical protein
MSQIAQQVMITPSFADPNNIRETFVDGPINVHVSGPTITITFTVARPDLDQAMKGQAITKMTAAVADRVTMPLHVAAQLRATLNALIQDQPSMPSGTILPGSNLKQ